MTINNNIMTMGTIKMNLINAYKTNNYIGQKLYKMQLVNFLVKNQKSQKKY